MRLCWGILTLIFFLRPTAMVLADDAAPAVSPENEVRLFIEVYLTIIRKALDDKNKWIYEKELSDCYSRLGDEKKAQEELAASAADDPQGVPAAPPVVEAIRDKAKKMVAAREKRGFLKKAAQAPRAEDEPIAAVPSATPVATSPLGTLTLGAQAGFWSANYASTTQGAEISIPVFLAVNLSDDLLVTASSDYLVGSYQGLGIDSLNLESFSDTSLGIQLGFKTLGLDSVLSETINLPTGNPSWTAQSATADLPSELVDPRYSAANFSLTTIYGISVPVDAARWGLGVGYVLNADYDPNAGSSLASTDVSPGNTLLFTLNRFASTGDGQSDIFQASAYFSFVTEESGAPLVCPGPNLNFSYAWNNQTAFSFEIGCQFYLPGQTAVEGILTPDPTYSSGPRFYLKSNYVFGAWSLAGQAKWVLPNGYGLHDADYVGGGYVLSLGPSWNLKVDGQDLLTLAASYNFVDSLDGGVDAQGNPVDVLYNYFNCSVSRSFAF